VPGGRTGRKEGCAFCISCSNDGLGKDFACNSELFFVTPALRCYTYLGGGAVIICVSQ